MKKIAFAGTDGRTLLWAFVVSTATSAFNNDDYSGMVFRGTPAMPKFTEIMNWPVTFIPTKDNSAEGYAAAIVEALRQETVDYVVPMPESLLFDGLVDAVEKEGFGDRILGLNAAAAFIEGDKINDRDALAARGVDMTDGVFH